MPTVEDVIRQFTQEDEDCEAQIQFGPGHWSINFPDNASAAKLLSRVANSMFK